MENRICRCGAKMRVGKLMYTCWRCGRWRFRPPTPPKPPPRNQYGGIE